MPSFSEMLNNLPKILCELFTAKLNDKALKAFIN